MIPNADAILWIERDSIRSWVIQCAEHLTGRVLDYGSGRQPYRDVVEAAGGEYVPHDLTGYPSTVAEADTNPDALRGSPVERAYDAILCTQVLQYVALYGNRHEEFTETPLLDLLDDFHRFLLPAGGWLVITGGTCWREIEAADHSRLTVSGIRHLLDRVGFDVHRCESRASLDFPGFTMSLGWGALARAAT